MPLRTCIGCRGVEEQARLVRFVVEASSARVKLDRARRLPGRGAWLHQTRACVDEAVHNSGFPKSFRRRTQPIDAGRLWASLTEDDKEREHE
jgi:predicted RNA-binding protein YlxR (DUF448 family)